MRGARTVDRYLLCTSPAVERRSLVLRGVLDLCLLALLQDQPAYGYELTERLADRGLPVASGSTYPLLARLEKAGLVVADRSAAQVLLAVGRRTGRPRGRSCRVA